MSNTDGTIVINVELEGEPASVMVADSTSFLDFIQASPESPIWIETEQGQRQARKGDITAITSMMFRNSLFVFDQ